jgi:drug/metabolite transporter (DMT)-like permease
MTRVASSRTEGDVARRTPVSGRALSGLSLAGITAVVSGISVFVNSYGVHAVKDPAVYTTAKNLFAAVALAAVAVVGGTTARRRGMGAVAGYLSAPATSSSDSAPSRSSAARRVLRWSALAYVGVIGGGVAFVLFFNGLARTTATSAAFLHDSLVVWVALLALPLLRERLSWWNVSAIALLVVGEVVIAGGIGHLTTDRGQLLVLAATLLWAVEVIVSKVLLRDLSPSLLALVRMGVGSVVLVVYLAGTGRFSGLVDLDGGQLKWVLVTGLLLGAYVGTWMTALSRARAVDVTSILVASALITALLQWAARTVPGAPSALGLTLIFVGTALAFVAGSRRAAWRTPRGIEVGGGGT